MLQVYEFYLLIRMLPKIFEDEGSKMARKFNLTHPQYLALAIIYYHERIMVSEIARIGSWHISTMMNLLSRLEGKKLIILEPLFKGKGKEVFLTNSGKDLAEKFFINSSEKIRKLYEVIGPKDFKQNMDKIYRILEEVQGSEATESIKTHMFKARKRLIQ